MHTIEWTTTLNKISFRPLPSNSAPPLIHDEPSRTRRDDEIHIQLELGYLPSLDGPATAFSGNRLLRDGVAAANDKVLVSALEEPANGSPISTSSGGSNNSTSSLKCGNKMDIMSSSLCGVPRQCMSQMATSQPACRHKTKPPKGGR